MARSINQTQNVMAQTLKNISDFYFERFGYVREPLDTPFNPRTKMIIVIPVYNEPSVAITLDSLQECESPEFPIEVIMVVNNSEDAESSVIEQNQNSIKEIETWNDQPREKTITCQIISALSLPRKHAGVGLARKIGMDEAMRRFSSIEYNGLIVCLDADCTVKTNYLQEVEANFCKEDFIAGNIYYEHPLIGDSSGIRKYELGLRYYVNALRYAEYPYSFHTIGSSMAVSAKTYAKSGGMNKRKAGEDFYFLHKLIPLGGFQELNSTSVYPSARVSDRVPFGTGKAMGRWVDQGNTELSAYSLDTFADLKQFISTIIRLRTIQNESHYNDLIEDLPKSIQEFLTAQNFFNILESCINQSSSEESFNKRIYSWLDGFMVLKFIHFSRDHYHPNVIVEECARELLQLHEIRYDGDDGGLLDAYRQLDQSK